LNEVFNCLSQCVPIDNDYCFAFVCSIHCQVIAVQSDAYLFEVVLVSFMYRVM
jgi:hypothetical protein